MRDVEVQVDKLIQVPENTLLTWLSILSTVLCNMPFDEDGEEEADALCEQMNEVSALLEKDSKWEVKEQNGEFWILQELKIFNGQG